jgi:hypothetical protein
VKRRLLFAAMAIMAADRAAAIAQPYVSEIIFTGATFCPAGFLPADGRLLPIAEYDTLFALLGTTYGGDGESTFALPMLKVVRTASGETLLPCIAHAGIFPSPT